MLRVRNASFWTNTDGSMTVYGLFIFMTIATLFGVSMDVASAYKARTELQIAADTASHAALYNNIYNVVSKSGAADLAVTIADANMSASKVTGTVVSSDVKFGIWNRVTRVFTVNGTISDDDERKAVMVTAVRSVARNNAPSTFLLDLVGINTWDVKAVSVTEAYRPDCLKEGWVADNLVDLQSNNSFYNGYCLHSNGTIKIGQNNYFEAGTVVSLPDTDDVQMAASGFTKNTGLQDALREGFYKIHVTDKLDKIYSDLVKDDTLNDTTDYIPSYITNMTRNAISVNKKTTMTAASLKAGQINVVTCSGNNSSLTIANGTTLSGLALVTNCEISFGQGAKLEDVLVYTSSTSSTSMSSPSGFTLGKNDDCADGGGAVILSKGSIKFASKMNAYGSQLIAKDDITFAANANGIEGASLVAGNKVDGTSNNTMGNCGTGMDSTFQFDYFHLAY